MDLNDWGHHVFYIYYIYIIYIYLKIFVFICLFKPSLLIGRKNNLLLSQAAKEELRQSALDSEQRLFDDAIDNIGHLFDIDPYV